MLILKGVSLGKYYPNPALRPYGDFDMYLFAKYDQANKLVDQADIEVNYKEIKHSTSLSNISWLRIILHSLILE